MTDAREPGDQGDEPAPDGPVSAARRGRWMVGWLLGAVGLTALAFGSGVLVRSPWEEAAQNAARTPSVTATVQVRTFTADEVVAIGTVSSGTVTTIQGSAADGSEAVVTATPLAAGAQVTAGSVLVEISGRPVIALPLPFVLYRDLAPGDSGTDVRALQQTLADLGLYSGEVDGAYGPGTSAAVRALYALTSATAPAPASDLVETVETARAALGEAQAAIASAERERDRAQRTRGQIAADQESTADDAAEAQSALDEAEAALGLARTAVTEAQAALSAAETAADTPLPRAETTPVAAGVSTLVRVAPLGTVLGDSGEGADTQGGGDGAAQILSGAPSASVRVDVADIDHLTVGTTVTVTAVRDSTRTAAATVTEISEFSTASALGDTPGYDVVVGFPEAEDLVFDDGESITATLAEGATTQEGLAVPLVAVRSEDGQEYLLVSGSDGPARVEVEVATTDAGYALVSGDGLSVGDVVEIDGTS